MKLKAFAISKMTREFLIAGTPLYLWPVTEVDVEDEKIFSQICIASWRWDVRSINEISNKLSECAWDALHLNFKFLLCDLISIPQDSPNIAEILIVFSNLYQTLHSVIAYKIDPEVKRPWLRNEAARILDSPTSLVYIYRKWKLSIPLKFSLIIRQICTRRLGLHELYFEKIDICDTDEALDLSLKDLQLFSKTDKRIFTTICINRNHQEYASDILLVYEINKKIHRKNLITNLFRMKTNVVLIPALVAIWAMIEGLSISVRGCDWDVNEISNWVTSILFEASTRLSQKIEVTTKLEDFKWVIVEGAINRELGLIIKEQPYELSKGIKDLYVINDQQYPSVLNSNFVEEFLGVCVIIATEIINYQIVEEPDLLNEDHPQYELLFDNNSHY